MFANFKQTWFGIRRAMINFRAISNKKKLEEKNQLKSLSKVPEKPTSSSLFDCIEKQPQNSVSIDKATIQLLEQLSLVSFDDRKILETLQKSIEFAAPIHQINTDGVRPMYTVLENEELTLRDDAVTEGNCRRDILQNAKIQEEDYFVSPLGNIPLQQKKS